jgi:hypothetical protein
MAVQFTPKSLPRETRLQPGKVHTTTHGVQLGAVSYNICRILPGRPQHTQRISHFFLYNTTPVGLKSAGLPRSAGVSNCLAIAYECAKHMHRCLPSSLTDDLLSTKANHSTFYLIPDYTLCPGNSGPVSVYHHICVVSPPLECHAVSTFSLPCRLYPSTFPHL